MTFCDISRGLQRKDVWGPKRSLAAAMLVTLGLATTAAAAGDHSRKAPHARPGAPSSHVKSYKADDAVLRHAAGNPQHQSSVIVTLVPGADVPPQFKKYARAGKLEIINGQVLDLPNSALAQLLAHPDIFQVHDNRPIGAHNYRTSLTVGANAVHGGMGLTGAGIGIAVIDSGITAWHDDLTNRSSKIYPYGNQRVSKFVDFVSGQSDPYDDNGHGSHVAGIIAGNGYDSTGQKAGIAPDASLVALKVLDEKGQGTISHIIAALNWVAANANTYNIRVVNLSVGAAIRESYWTDPLTLAAKALTDRGITVVAAAGNFGTNAAGNLQYGGITAPGNAPWVLTVGASSTMGTVTRRDDTMGNYSSAGPTYIDFAAKPDLVAPGTGTVSLAAPGSTFYQTKAQYLVAGSIHTSAFPYLSLTGTSMAAPVVSGTVALMLQANPALTPNLVKAILQYTAQVYPEYNALREGAGFLNTLGAVRLAKFYATARPGDRIPVQRIWSKRIIWGNHQLTGGYILPDANAWATNIVWGVAKTLATNQNIVWGIAAVDNIVWGISAADNIVWGVSGDLDNIVWGIADGDENVVWGSDCGGADCDNVVWGTADPVDNIVWGIASAHDNIVWGISAADNIVWGISAADNIVWGVSADVDQAWASSDRAESVFYPDSDSSEPLPDSEVMFEEGGAPVDAPQTTVMPGGGF